MSKLDDNSFMKRALELAGRGLGSVSPNPMVGAVLALSDGVVVGEGWHERCGEAHAEVNAIGSVADQSMICKSTLYVTLEPCSHFGKTPPCADLIIEKQIRRVVVACADPFEKVAGRGIERMREAEIEVVVGVMEREARELNRRFLTFVEKKRPYIILKWAQSADGALDIVRTQNQSPAWMTGEQARQLVHRWRSQEDAIMVGRKTAQLDNPELTVRAVAGRNPIRVVVDGQMQLLPTLKIFDQQAPTMLFSAQNTAIDYAQLYVIDCNQEPLHQILNVLHNKGVQSLIVEGGAQLLRSFIEQNLWDEARIFTAQQPISSYYPQVKNSQIIAAPTLPGERQQCLRVGSSDLIMVRNG